MANLLDYALTDVASVKETLGLSSGDHSKDNLIIRNINRATEMIEAYCQRRFKETAYVDELYHGTGTSSLVLRETPINSSETFTLKARTTSLNDNSTYTIPTDLYFIDYGAGIINALTNFWGNYDRWLVTYTAGYATIPSDIAEACVTLAAYLVENPTLAGNVRLKQEGSRKIEYYDTQGKDPIALLGLDSILASYSNSIITGLG